MKYLPLGIILVLLLLKNIASSQTEAYPFTIEQKKAVDSLLADSVNSRLALTSDCDISFFKQFHKENPDYTPYFIESDLDGDGLTDFVIALKHGKDYTVFLFRATKDGYRKPLFVCRIDWLNQCGFIAGNGLLQIEQFPRLGYGPILKWNKQYEELEPINMEAK